MAGGHGHIPVQVVRVTGVAFTHMGAVQSTECGRGAQSHDQSHDGIMTAPLSQRFSDTLCSGLRIEIAQRSDDVNYVISV